MPVPISLPAGLLTWLLGLGGPGYSRRTRTRGGERAGGGSHQRLAVERARPRIDVSGGRNLESPGPHMFKTPMEAGTWSDLSSDLTSQNVWRVVIDPRMPTTLYAVTVD